MTNTFDLTSQEIESELEQMKTQHTPTPWTHINNGMNQFVTIPHVEKTRATIGEKLLIAQVFNYGYGENQECHERTIANAAFIVRACNAHDELVEALEAANKFLLDHGHANSGNNPLNKMWKALAKVKGEA